MWIRGVAVAASIVAIVLFGVCAAFTPADPTRAFSLEAWGFVCVAIALLVFAIEPFIITRQQPPVP